MRSTMRGLTSREVEVVRALQSIGAETVCGIEQWVGRTGLSSALSRLKASGHAQHRGGRWSLTPEAAAACPEDLMVLRGAANDVRTPPDGQAPLFPPVEDGADATVLEPGDVAAPLLAVLGEVAEALGGDVPLVQIADRVREAVAASNAARDFCEATDERAVSDIFKRAALAAKLAEAERWAELRAGHLDRLVEAVGGGCDWAQAVERAAALTAERDAAVRRAAVAEEYLEAACLAARLESGSWHKLAGEVETLAKERDAAQQLSVSHGMLLDDTVEALKCDTYLEVPGEAAWLVAENRTLNRMLRERGDLLDRVAAAVGGSWEEAVGKVETLRVERERALIAVRERDARTIPDTLHTHITREKHRGVLLARAASMLGCPSWDDVPTWTRAVLDTHKSLRDERDRTTSLLDDVCTALQCASHDAAPEAAKGMADTFGAICDAAHERAVLLDRVATALGGSWEEAVATVEALPARQAEADANERGANEFMLRQSRRADDAEATLCGVCKVLGCELADVEDVVTRLVAERGNLRREVEAAEQVERALLKALADAGAALAREQAAVMVNAVRARSMRRGEE